MHNAVQESTCAAFYIETTVYAPDNIRPMLYDDARWLIRDGDNILFWVDRRRLLKPSTWLITTIGKSPYVHASMAYCYASGCGSDQIDLLETCQWVGGQQVALAGQVMWYPGQYVVFRPHDPFDGKKAVKEMLKVRYQSYGWWNLFVSSLRHTLITSNFLPPFTDDNLDGSAPFCSQGVSRADRAGGRDPRPDHADIATEPGHLSAPDFAEPVCRLYWDRIPEAEQ